MMTLGRAHGMMMSERASPRHQKLWFNSKAAPSPSRNCRPTTPIIQTSEFHSEIQKTIHWNTDGFGLDPSELVSAARRVAGEHASGLTDAQSLNALDGSYSR